ncbi:MAG: hypothetical protein E6K13_02335 [Methanobacteriota archaeon]|nr:MAG: hypothetical protein E6K13_02335 [Euryarchaeota archaeon]
MGNSYDTGGRREKVDLEGKTPHELLLKLGGALAMLLSSVITAIRWSQGPITGSELTKAMTFLVLNIVLGGSLWIASVVMRRNVMNGAIVAAVVSVILIWFGGDPGLIGGIVGILGAIVGAASPYLPWSRNK